METAAVLKECDQRMDKSVEYLRKELHGIRTGRANSSLLDRISDLIGFLYRMWAYGCIRLGQIPFTAIFWIAEP